MPVEREGVYFFGTFAKFVSEKKVFGHALFAYTNAFSIFITTTFPHTNRTGISDYYDLRRMQSSESGRHPCEV